MPLVLGWIRFLFDSNSSSLTYWSHIFLKNDKIIQFLILRNRHSTIKAILTARFGEVEVAVGRKFNCALTVVLCREWRLLPTFLSGILRSCHSTYLEFGTVHIFGHVINCSNLSRQYISKFYFISYITNRLDALFLISKTFHPQQPRSTFQYSSERNPESENRKDLSDRTR